MSKHDENFPAPLPLIVVNGFGAPFVVAHSYGMYFRAHGHDVTTVSLFPMNVRDIRHASRLLDSTIDGVLARTNAPKVNVIGMSLGGLIGLYFIKCAGGDRKVNRFISVGGPLEGSSIADILCLCPLLRLLPALRQTRPNSKIINKIRSAPTPAGVKLFSVGTKGDFITPRRRWDIDGVMPVLTQFGFSPVGHWCLFIHPGNLKTVLDLLV